MKSWKRSIRSTNYCHSLLRAERVSGGWNSGLREDSWWWNDNSIYSWTNNLSFSPSRTSLSRIPRPFISLDLFVSFLLLSPSFLSRVRPLFPTRGDWLWHCPHATFSPLSFISICHALLFSLGAGWRVGWRGARRDKRGETGRNWYLHFCHNATFRCGRSFAAALMACDEGEKGEEGGESGRSVVPLHLNNPQIQVRQECLQIISAATSPQWAAIVIWKGLWYVCV